MNERFYPALLIAGGGVDHVSAKRLTIADTHATLRGLLEERTKKHDEYIPAAVFAAISWL